MVLRLLLSVCICYVLVTGKIGWDLAWALPFFRWRTQTFVIKARGLGPNTSVKNSNDDITFECASFNLLWKSNEVPWLCCMQLLFFARKHRHHTLLSYKLTGAIMVNFNVLYMCIYIHMTQMSGKKKKNKRKKEIINESLFSYKTTKNK